MKKLIITIDGPAASGKEKIAKYISKKWKLNHLDSGILYRRLALIFLIENIDFKNTNKIKNKLKEINEISFRNSKNIRTQVISKLASKIAVHDCV
ncbi:(d)CMP kinase, partial [Pelagibacteraceae bacterium]|nr:(d)CMP kinase [Pelagibacteraceae bacterium]